MVKPPLAAFLGEVGVRRMSGEQVVEARRGAVEITTSHRREHLAQHVGEGHDSGPVGIGEHRQRGRIDGKHRGDDIPRVLYRCWPAIGKVDSQSIDELDRRQDTGIRVPV